MLYEKDTSAFVSLKYVHQEYVFVQTRDFACKLDKSRIAKLSGSVWTFASFLS